ncbi:MAG: ACP S-malonyltransferase [Bacillota bacterium]
MRIAFVFPGQGSQYVGMGKELFDRYTEARETYLEANEALGFDLAAVCFTGPEDMLKKTAVTQPAILTTSIAILRVLQAVSGLQPSVSAGHSLGEYAALVAAGALSFNDAVKVVRNRGEFMEEAAPAGSGGMAAILGLEREKVEEVCREAASGIVEVANYNCPGQIVIAGEAGALEQAMAMAREKGAKRVVPLAVSGPFHSSLMAPAGEKLAGVLAEINIGDPRIPVIANISGDFVRTAEEIRHSLIKQVSGSVRWEDSVLKMSANGVTHFVEVGPGRVLSGLIKKIVPAEQLYNVEDINSLEKTVDNLKGVI